MRLLAHWITECSMLLRCTLYPGLPRVSILVGTVPIFNFCPYTVPTRTYIVLIFELFMDRKGVSARDEDHLQTGENVNVGFIKNI